MGAIPWTKEEIDTLINLNKQGLNYKEISNQIKTRTYEACLGMANRLGIKSAEKSNVDVDFFKRNNEFSNYVLGYWLADGCIMKKSGGYYFSIVSVDIEHLLKIKDTMKIRNGLQKNSGDAHEIRIGNKKLVQSIISLGGKYNKTNTIKFNNFNISNEYFYDFLRGYFDGDGNIGLSNYVKKDGTKSIDRVKFTGSKNVIHSLYSILQEKHKCSISEDNRNDKSDCWYLSLYGDDARNILDKMYKNSNIYLDRKYNIYIMSKRQRKNMDNLFNKLEEENYV